MAKKVGVHVQKGSGTPNYRAEMMLTLFFHLQESKGRCSQETSATFVFGTTPMTNSDGLEVQFPYEFVRALAGQLLGKRGRYGISATSVVHEAFVAAPGTVPVASIQRPRAWWGTVVRHILVRLIRRRSALKRGGGRKIAPLNGDVERNCRIQHAKPLLAEQQLLERLAVAMERARREAPKVADILEMLAAGKSPAEIAASLGVSVPTARTRSKLAQRWLRGQLVTEN